MNSGRRAEFHAAHTYAFAAGFLITLAVSIGVKHGPPSFSITAEDLIETSLGILFALLEAALYSLGCAWGGVSRPHRISWALACGIATAAGFLLYGAYDHSFPPPTNLEEAKQQYTRGTMAVAYVFLAPVVAGLACAALSKRAR